MVTARNLRELSPAVASPVSIAKSAATDVTISVTTSAQHAKLQAREKHGAKEGCKTKRQEYVTLNEADKHDGEPEHRKSEPQMKRENFFPSMAKQENPIPLSERRPPSHPTHQHHQPDDDGN